MSLFSGPSKNRLVNFYLLLISSRVPECRSVILGKSGVSPLSMTFDFLVENGFIEETTRPMKEYMDYQRRGSRLVKAWFVITDSGKEVVKMYEQLFSALGLSREVRKRKQGYHY